MPQWRVTDHARQDHFNASVSDLGRRNSHRFAARIAPRVNADTVGAWSEILVAAATLPAGTLLRAKDLNWKPTNRPEPDQIFRAAGGLGNTSPEIDQQLRTEVYGAALRTG